MPIFAMFLGDPSLDRSTAHRCHFNRNAVEGLAELFRVFVQSADEHKSLGACLWIQILLVSSKRRLYRAHKIGAKIPRGSFPFELSLYTFPMFTPLPLYFSITSMKDSLRRGFKVVQSIFILFLIL